MTKRVLIITYYWPPSGGAGVQRWLKTSKYLKGMDLEPIIYTVDGGEAPVIDDSLNKDVFEGIEILKEPIWEPYSLYKKFIGQKKEKKIQTGFLTEDKKPKTLENISVWIRGNFFVPDARMFWIKPSVKRLKAYLKENPVDAIVSTGPPHSVHLIAMALKKETGTPWLADFRDPWTDIDFYDKLKLTSWADKKHRRLEKEVLKNASAISTVSPGCAEGLQYISNRDIHVVNNGFDREDFPEPMPILDTDFSILHMGAMNADRNPHRLWKVLEDICSDNVEFKNNLSLQFIGSTDITVKKSLEQRGLSSLAHFHQHLAHREAIKKACSAQLLLLPINDTPNAKSVAPGKLYEYLGAARPILCIGPLDGNAAEILRETKAGKTFAFKDEKTLKECILNYYELYSQGCLTCSSKHVEAYSREQLARKFKTILEELK